MTEYIDRNLTKKEDKIKYISSKNYTVDQKWGLYKYDVFSDTERDDGSSQLSDIEYIVANGVSKRDFIDVYNKMQKYEIDVPKQSEYKEMRENGVGLRSFVDYKVEVKDKIKSKIASGELKKGQQLKASDKIQILLDSDYSLKEKKAIYENYIKGEKDIEYSVMDKAGINFDEYLRYKQQEFTSDKKDDGSLNGKTVTKSKQKKVVEYLNSMDITGDQRLLLYAINGYGTSTSQKNELADYVYKLDMTNDEKLRVYNKFSGFKVYKDGRVTW